MDEQGLRDLIGEVKGGRLSRRAFVRRMIALGLTAPLATAMLDHAGDFKAAARELRQKGYGASQSSEQIEVINTAAEPTLDLPPQKPQARQRPTGLRL